VIHGSNREPGLSLLPETVDQCRMRLSVRILLLACVFVIVVALNSALLSAASAATRPPVALGITIDPPLDPTPTNPYSTRPAQPGP
jgi:hypothetical protein